jgi:hypothetical protein
MIDDGASIRAKCTPDELWRMAASITVVASGPDVLTIVADENRREHRPSRRLRPHCPDHEPDRTETAMSKLRRWFRSSITGRFVTRDQADHNRDTTIEQTEPLPDYRAAMRDGQRLEPEPQ